MCVCTVSSRTPTEPRCHHTVDYRDVLYLYVKEKLTNEIGFSQQRTEKEKEPAPIFVIKRIYS